MADSYFENLQLNCDQSKILFLDGNDLKTEELYDCARGLYKIKVSEDAKKKVARARSYVEKLLLENKIVYGITTGFGKFENVCIGASKVTELQENLVRSHCCGVGPYLSPYRVRMLMALRINVLAKGYSGISLRVLEQVVDAFNAFCCPYVPEKGSVGCSGDLAPMAHMTLGLMGEGRMWSPETGWGRAADILRQKGLQPLTLGAKEGLAMINGTQMVSSLGAEAVERAGYVTLQADVLSAFSFSVLNGDVNSLNNCIQRLKLHKGQKQVADKLCQLLCVSDQQSYVDDNQSNRFDQDLDALRNIPAIHGIVHDTIEFVKRVITTEINSASDNPLIFEEDEKVLTCGNFHGEYPGKVLDYLAISVNDLGQISKRRIDSLLKLGNQRNHLILLQRLAANLVSENKVLCHPSTADSIPTSGGQEDHVSMGAFAARKALQVTGHVEQILAMELLVICQIVDSLNLQNHLPVSLKEVYHLSQSILQNIQHDHCLSDDIEKSTTFIQKREIWNLVKHYLHSPEEIAVDENGKMKNASTEIMFHRKHKH